MTAISAVSVGHRRQDGPDGAPHNALLQRTCDAWAMETVAKNSYAGRLDLAAALVDPTPLRLNQQIAEKAAQLSDIGMSRRAIGQALDVDDKTVGKPSDGGEIRRSIDEVDALHPGLTAS